jgi:hypothetical protein
MIWHNNIPTNKPISCIRPCGKDTINGRSRSRGSATLPFVLAGWDALLRVHINKHGHPLLRHNRHKKQY